MNLVSNLSRRGLNLLGVAVCGAMMAFALYAQHGMGLEPCPLCVFQRVAVLVLGAVFLLAAAHDPGRFGARVYGLAIAVAAGAGAVIAGRHVWLQNLPPDRVPECGPGLDYMLDVFPLMEAVDMVFAGSGECAEVSWRFLGLTMPTWVLIGCVGLGLAGLIGNWVLRRRGELQPAMIR
jgi:disulfide bond formation protein DsbB